jgi:flagellar biosynthetic protein FlhB
MVRFFILRAVELDPTKDRFVAGVFFTYFIKLVAPVLSVAVVSALFSNLVQTGLLFTTKPLVPDFTRILPRFGQYFQRTLFSMEGLFNFFKSIAKMAIIGSVAWLLITSNIEKLANLQKADIWLSVGIIAGLAAKMLIISALLLLALSIPDVMFQRWRYRESLKMTKEEVKEERKMYEGDPHVRSRLRSRMREIMNQNMAVNVPKADVVITNPTHFAVALEYNAGSNPAPQVTAKGADKLLALDNPAILAGLLYLVLRGLLGAALILRGKPLEVDGQGGVQAGRGRRIYPRITRINTDYAFSLPYNPCNFLQSV